MGKPGLHWGTLQALDKHSLQRLVEWLTQATSPQQRRAGLTSCVNSTSSAYAKP